MARHSDMVLPIRVVHSLGVIGGGVAGDPTPHPLKGLIGAITRGAMPLQTGPEYPPNHPLSDGRPHGYNSHERRSP